MSRVGGYMIDYIKKTYKGTPDSFFKLLESNLINNNKMFIITANAETFMKAKSIDKLDKILRSDNSIITPDGIGVIKAAKYLGIKGLKERITGVDTSYKLLELANTYNKSIYLLGATKEVIELTVKNIKRDYPNVNISGYCNGYVEDKDAVFEEIKKIQPDIILVALGIPNQEILINKHINDFDKGIFMGVGGTFDVISGTKKRAPKFIQKINMEWLYRVIGDKSRIKRVYNGNIKFAFEVIKLKIK